MSFIAHVNFYKVKKMVHIEYFGKAFVSDTVNFTENCHYFKKRFQY